LEEDSPEDFIDPRVGVDDIGPEVLIPSIIWAGIIQFPGVGLALYSRSNDSY